MWVLITEIFIKYSNIRLGCGYIYLKRLQTGELHDFTFKFLEFLPLVSCQVEFNERQLDTRRGQHLDPCYDFILLVLLVRGGQYHLFILTNKKLQPSEEPFLPRNLSIISELDSAWGRRQQADWAQLSCSNIVIIRESSDLARRLFNNFSSPGNQDSGYF